MSALAEPTVDAPAPRKPRVRKPKAAVVAPAPPAAPEVVVPPAKPKRVRKPKVVVVVEPPPAEEPPAEPVLTLNAPELPPAPIVPASPVDLSEDKEKEDFARLEEIVRKGLRAFVEVGNALKEIATRKLYRHDGFLSFEDYIAARWDLSSRQRGHQLIEASTVVGALQQWYDEHPGEHPFLPLVESHARGLFKLLGRPEKLAQAWAQIVETAPVRHGAPHITGQHVEEVVREVMGLGKNPGVGPGEVAPTPPTLPSPVSPPPPTVTLLGDLEPPGVVAPPIGQEPDPLEGGPKEVTLEEIEVLTKGETVVLTPEVALGKVITSLKLGEFSHKDILVVRLLEEVSAGIGAWFDSEDDAVEWDDDTAHDAGEEEE